MVRNERTYWTTEEDQRLVDLVQQNGTNKWVVIASNFEGKDNKSCSHRYNNYLDPLLNKSPFSPWEDSVVSQLYKEVGPRWKYIAKCLSGSQGRRSANTVKNRYQALKKYWVPLGAEQDAIDSEEEEMQVPPPQTEPPAEPQLAVRADVPGAAINSTQQQPQVMPEGYEVEGANGWQINNLPPGMSQQQDPKGLYACLREGATTADGPLSHKFLVLQSRLHKASQLIARENHDEQGWEHDKQKIHNHLDSIKNILDSRVLSLYTAPAPQPLPQLPAEVPTTEQPPVLAALPTAENQPPAEPPVVNPPAADKEPDAKSELSNVAKSELSNVSASSGAGKRTAEGLKKGKKGELDHESSEMDVACILNDLANAPTEAGAQPEKKATPTVSAEGQPAKKRAKPQGSPLTA